MAIGDIAYARKSPKKPPPLSFGTFLGGDSLRIVRRIMYMYLARN